MGLSQTENPSPEGAAHGYEPFQDICLTDTFQLYEKSDLLSNLLTNNSDHHKRQKALDIRGIMGTSPYPMDNYGYTLRDAITDIGLAHFQRAYPAQDEGSSITKENLSYYIYSLLHSPDYRSRYADNLSKELPRIPAGKTFADFSALSQAGRDLAHWHQNYETVACHPGVAVEEVLAPAASHAPTVADRLYKVTKMKFGKTKDASGKNVNDKTTVIYNETITLKTSRSPRTSMWSTAARSRVGHGAPVHHHRQGQRHHHRRQPLGHRNHA